MTDSMLNAKHILEKVIVQRRHANLMATQVMGAAKYLTPGVYLCFPSMAYNISDSILIRKKFQGKHPTSLFVRVENLWTTNALSRLKSHIVGRRRHVIRDNRYADFPIAGSVVKTTGNSSLRIFDVRSDLVATIHQSNWHARKELHVRHLLSNYIRSPEIVFQDIDAGIVIEKYVGNSDLPSIFHPFMGNILSNLTDCYAEQLCSVKQTPGTLSLAALKHTANACDIGDLVKRISEVFGVRGSLEFPRVVTHGDIALENVRIDETCWWIVDWEHTGRRSIVYDLVNGLLVEVLDKARWLGVEDFMIGDLGDVLMARIGALVENNVRTEREEIIGFVSIEKLLYLLRRRAIGRERIIQKYHTFIDEFERRYGRRINHAGKQ